MKDILATIKTLCEEKRWTEYQLAERSGIPQSTISSWYRKSKVPTLSSMEKICCALGITLTQLFLENEEVVTLTEDEKELLRNWGRLNETQQTALRAIMENLQ